MVKYKKIAGLGLIGFAAVGTFVLTLQHEPVRTESSPEKSNLIILRISALALEQLFKTFLPLKSKSLTKH
jgi:hypothetical protein